MSLILTKTLLHTTDTYIKKLREGGIVTVEDLIGHYPRTYKDKSEVLEYFSYVNIQEANTLRVTIETITSERTRNKKDLIKAVLRDKGGFFSEAVWFNRKFLLQKFHAGDEVIIHGKPKYEYGRLSFPSADMDLARQSGSTIVPVYPDCNYIPGAWFEGKLALVKEHFHDIAEVIPNEIRKAKGFRLKYENLLAIHFPTSTADFERARDELAYEELFSLQYEGLRRKREGEQVSTGRATAIAMNPEAVKEIIAKLPYSLTGGQKIVLFQILKDMERPFAMQRLLQGDVGTGKTIVVMIAAIHAILESRKMQNLSQSPRQVSSSSQSPHPSPLPEGEGEDGVAVRKENSPKYVIDLARKARTSQTSAEEFLWDMLRDRRFEGLKFRRQHPIHRYIADFFCDELSLVIELDGKIHENQKEYDAMRDEFMKNGGYKVIRIANDEVFDTPEFVLEKILECGMRPSPSGRGAGGEGYEAVKPPIQVAILAPTEILARQHFAGSMELLSSFAITSDFLVGSLTTKQKTDVKARLKNGDLSVVIGTHALIEDDVHFKNLTFTIVDEQHRFGVEQRRVLEQYCSVNTKSEDENLAPLMKGGDDPASAGESGGSVWKDRTWCQERGLVFTNSHLPYKKENIVKAQELRRNMTEPERVMYYTILDKIDAKFLRQRPIDNYIVDFYAPEYDLVVEVDGESHFDNDENIQYDQKRTEILEGIYGLKVLRFTNHEVVSNREWVYETIRKQIPPTPLHKGGEIDNITRDEIVLHHDKKTGTLPHVLNMTATPIPRTLSLTIYGDQDISVLSEYPAGRKPIYTRVVKEEQRNEIYNFIAEEVRAGRQVYWISPLVEESESLDIASAVNTQEILASIFPNLRIGLIHGKMRGKEKDAIMQEFYDRKIDILSSTSVVEVGVDNPNATVICIEAAERFGLSQLHQFRGRVGRGQDQSYCYLFTTKSYTGERLRAMERTNDGFELSEIDLELRGPGEVYGVRQSGLPEFKIADLKDLGLVSEIRADIEEWMGKTGK